MDGIKRGIHTDSGEVATVNHYLIFVLLTFNFHNNYAMCFHDAVYGKRTGGCEMCRTKTSSPHNYPHNHLHTIT